MGAETYALIMLGTIVFAIVIGVHVAIALSAIPLIFGLIFMGERVLPMYPVQAFGMMSNYPFVAAPLFIYMGALMEHAGVAEKLYDAFYQLLGPVRGGLALATIGMAIIFGACTGIVGAGVILIGLLALPSMLSRGYNKALATGSIMVGGGLGVMIPPSIMLILYGCAAGVSISQLYIASAIPGVLLGLMYMAFVYIWAIVDPSIGKPIQQNERIRGKELANLVGKSLVPPVVLILAVMGSIFFGLVGPSEAGAMGVLGALGLIVLAGRMNLDVLTRATTSTLKITTAVLMICLGGQLFTGVFISMGGDVALRKIILGFQFGQLGTIIIMLLIVWLLGFVMDWIALIFILVPIFGPLITTVGVDPLYFAILFCSTLEISNMTPPFAYSAFYLKTIAPEDVTMGTLYRGCVPFFFVNMAMVILLLMFPSLILWLPSLMR
ncbi:MAG: TRAP transporter large permease subunit [Thermodesulfobacteriota bacterium]